MHWNANLSGSGCKHFWQNVQNNWRQAKPAGEFQKQPISRESRNTGGGGWTEAGPNLAGWNLCPRLWGGDVLSPLSFFEANTAADPDTIRVAAFQPQPASWVLPGVFWSRMGMPRNRLCTAWGTACQVVKPLFFASVPFSFPFLCRWGHFGHVVPMFAFLGPNLAISGHFGSVFAFLGTIMAIRGHFVRVFLLFWGLKIGQLFFGHLNSFWVKFDTFWLFGLILANWPTLGQLANWPTQFEQVWDNFG